MVNISQERLQCEAIRFSVKRDGKEVARAYIYLIKNDLHDEPYAFLEDVFVDESCRGQGTGTELLNTVIEEVKELGCYKFIATSRISREGVHRLYERLGFENHGFEFRMTLKK